MATRWDLPPGPSGRTNGLRPKLIGDRWIACGNGQVRVIDLDAPDLTITEYGPGYPAGPFLRSSLLGIVTPIVDGRRVDLLDLETGRRGDSGIVPSTFPWVVTSAGYVLGRVGHQYYLNGEPIDLPGGPYEGEPVAAGPFLLLQRPPTYASVLFDLRTSPPTIVRELGIDAKNAEIIVGPDGLPWVTCNGPTGGVWVSGAIGTVALATSGSYGEGSGTLFFLEDGSPWAATKAYGYAADGVTILCYVALRPVGETTAICFEAPADQVCVRQTDRGLDVIGAADIGGGNLPLTIWRDVPIDAARIDPGTLFSPAKPQPRPDPKPPQPKCTLTIPRWTKRTFGQMFVGIADPQRWDDPSPVFWSAPPLEPPPGTLLKPVMEMSGWDDTLRGAPLFCGHWPSNAQPNQLIETEIAYTKRKGRTSLTIHVDSIDQEAWALENAEKVAAAGLLPILCAHAVQDAAVFEAQLRRFAATALARKWAWGVTVNASLIPTGTGFLKDGPTFVQLLDKLGALLEAVPGCCCLWFFGVYKLKGYRDFPDLEPFVVDVCAQMETPALYPGVLTPATPTPPSTPIETPADPSDRPGARGGGHADPVAGMNDGRNAAVVAAGVGIGLALRLWFRKLFRRGGDA